MFLWPQAEGRCGKGIQCFHCSSLPQVPAYPLGLEGAWRLVLGALCPLRGTGGAFGGFTELGRESWLSCDISVPWRWQLEKFCDSLWPLIESLRRAG